MKSVLFLLLMIASTALHAQPMLDSLLKVFESAEEAKVKDEAVRAYGRELMKMDAATWLMHAERLEDVSTRQGNSLGMAIVENLVGTYYYNKGEYVSAEGHYLKSLEHRKEVNDKAGLAAILNNLGSLYQAKSDLPKSLEYHLNSLRIKEELKDERSIAASYNNIANVYRQLKQFDKALQYHHLSLAIRQKVKDNRGVSMSNLNIANVYIEMKQRNEGLRYYNNVIKLQAKDQDPAMLGAVYNSLGFVYKEMGEYDKAMKYLERSLAYRKEKDDKNGIATSYANIGAVHLAKNELEKAKEYYSKSLKLSQANGDKDNIQEATKSLAIIAEKEKDYAKALTLMEDANKVKDSIYSIQGQRAIAEMETKYETEKKEAAIRLLQKENELQEIRSRQQMYIAIGVLALLLIAGVFLYSYLRIRHEKKMVYEKATMEKARLHAVINTQEEERKRISAELHDGLGPVLSAAKLNLAMLDHVNKDAERYKMAVDLIDQSCTEIRQISHMMMPAVLVKSGLPGAIRQLTESLNSAGQISFHFNAENIDVRYDGAVEVNLYRIVQELLNNIVKYANATEVQVQLFEEKQELHLMIEDNGNGYDTNLLKASNGNGWANIQSRLSMLGGTIEIDSQKGKAGTVVYVIAPVWSVTPSASLQ